MLYHILKLVSKIVSAFPLMLRRQLGNAVGNMCWPLIPGKRRRLAIENVQRSLSVSSEQAAWIARQSAVRFGRIFMEVLALPRLIASDIRQYAPIEGLEHLQSALLQGRGVVLVTAHSGNWEVMGASLAQHGIPLVSVAQKQTNPAMDRFLNEYRTLSGMRITYKSGVRDMIRLLGEGQVIGLLADQDADNDGVFVEFFGRLASTAQGAAYLARLKEAPIVPAFITEQPDGTHWILVHPAFWVERTSDREQDILVTTQKLTGIIERHIRQYPQEWFWLHNRWKNQPQSNNGVR